jgi:hypothetical protein
MPVKAVLSGRNASRLQAVDGLTQKRQAFATDMALRTAKNKVFS